MAKKSAGRKTAKKTAKKRSASPLKGSVNPKAKPEEPLWVKSLRNREQPLSLAIEEYGEIAFWKYSFDGPHEYNLMAWHPEGDLDFGFDAEQPEDEEDCCANPVSEWDNQYLPGHPIHDALTPRERKVLGMEQGDVGGPASDGCMLVTVACTLEDLNDIIRQKKLPFVVVEDKRFQKPTKSLSAKT
jgi:hypothetical protein